METTRLNATAASLLGFLHERPMSGWDLVAHAQQTIGNFWSLTSSQVYRELQSMAANGLIVAGERGSRDRRPFTITDEGRAAFATWIAEPPGGETIRFPLLVTMMFGKHVAPQTLANFIADHERIHIERLAAYRAQLAAIPEAYRTANPYSMSTLTFGIKYEQMVVDWFADLPDTIRNPDES